jgi:hypothetical protein
LPTLDSDRLLQRCSRICWNTKHWKEPTGEAAQIETPGSYAAEFGFGHEEWLFNFAWLHPPRKGGPAKFKYGYLQPIGKHRGKYEQKVLSVLLYTVAPNRQRIAVAKIDDLFVPPVPELRSAVDFMRRRRWLDEMKNDLEALEIRSSFLEGRAEHIFNIRFEPSNVTFFEPLIILPRTHGTYRINRYQLLTWDGRLPQYLTSSTVSKRTGGKPRSEDERTRAGMAGSTYSPRHVKLQNALYDHLCEVHGRTSVFYERDFVDIALEASDEIIYFEIKIALTARGCIRQAVGQLLEYGFYPNEKRASKLVVVGDREASAEDREYLSYLRAQFELPLHYRQWSWEDGSLLAEA